MARSRGLATIRPSIPEYQPGEDMGAWANRLVAALQVILGGIPIPPAGLGWQVDNLSAKTKTLDATGASAATVRTVLASLIQELKDAGELSN